MSDCHSGAALLSCRHILFTIFLFPAWSSFPCTLQNSSSHFSEAYASLSYLVSAASSPPLLCSPSESPWTHSQSLSILSLSPSLPQPTAVTYIGIPFILASRYTKAAFASSLQWFGLQWELSFIGVIGFLKSLYTAAFQASLPLLFLMHQNPFLKSGTALFVAVAFSLSVL